MDHHLAPPCRRIVVANGEAACMECTTLISGGRVAGEALVPDGMLPLDADSAVKRAMQEQRVVLVDKRSPDRRGRSTHTAPYAASACVDAPSAAAPPLLGSPLTAVLLCRPSLAGPGRTPCQHHPPVFSLTAKWFHSNPYVLPTLRFLFSALITCCRHRLVDWQHFHRVYGVEWMLTASLACDRGCQLLGAVLAAGRGDAPTVDAYWFQDWAMETAQAIAHASVQVMEVSGRQQAREQPTTKATGGCA